MQKTNNPQIYQLDKIFLTKNLTPGKKASQERLFFDKNNEYREWSPKTSKIAAALRNKLSNLHLKEGDIILYLGASSGTTVSHISDIIGTQGLLFAVEISPTMMRELFFLCETRKYIALILADANQPQTYANKIIPVDWLYQDISQRNQTEIFIKNLSFLKKNGHAILALKARSVNVAKDPQKIFEETKQELQKHVEVLETITLEPYQKDHCLFVCRKIK